MQTFDSVIEKMIRDGILTVDGALPYATNANNLLLKISDLSGAPQPVAAPAPPKEEGSMLDMIER